MSRKKDKSKNSLNVSTREDVTDSHPSSCAGAVRNLPQQSPVKYRPANQPSFPEYRQTFTLAGGQQPLLFVAFPLTWSLSLAAWLTLGWLRLIQQEKAVRKTTLSRHLVYRLSALARRDAGVRLAHPILYLGWFALIGVSRRRFTPALFVGLTRVAVHRLKVPLMLAAPVIWVGLETIRSYFLTGFARGVARPACFDSRSGDPDRRPLWCVRCEFRDHVRRHLHRDVTATRRGRPPKPKSKKVRWYVRCMARHSG